MIESGVMLKAEIPTKEYRNLLVIEERYRLLLRCLSDNARLNIYRDKLGLENDIEIVVGDENIIEKLDYDILMIAAFAEPKERVFSNVWKYVDEKTPVLYRTYTGMRAILYSPVLETDTRGFHKEVMMLPSGKTNNTSVLIRKII